MSGEAGALSGSTVGAIGSIYSGQSTANALEVQARENDQNAKLAREQGDYNSMRAGMLAAQHIGGMKAGFGANGVESTSGSVLATLNASAMNAEMDVQNIQKGAAVKAINFENEASMERLGAGNAKTASYFNAFSQMTLGSGKAFGEAPSGGSGGVGGGTAADDVSLDEGGDAATGSEAGAGEAAGGSSVASEEALAFV